MIRLREPNITSIGLFYKEVGILLESVLDSWIIVQLVSWRKSTNKLQCESLIGSRTHMVK